MAANFRTPADGPEAHSRGDSGNGRTRGPGREIASREIELTIVVEESQRGVPIALSTRWKRPAARVVALANPLTELVPLIASSSAEVVILASLSCVCVLDTAKLMSLAAEVGGQIFKVSAGRTPVEMYVARRDTIVALLESALARRTDRSPLRKSLFEDALLPAIDVIEEVPGEVLFQNNLMEYYRGNIWVTGNSASERYLRILSRLPELSEKGAESHIAEKGFARNSWLASGVEVEGEVEDSIIFPNVHIRKNSFVSRSIVMNGNRIGAGVEIHNALLLPFSAELPRATPNIGDNCSIGARTSTAKNADFPDQIRDGLTVVGMNAEIPAGLRIEAAACIGPGVPSSVLRKMKLVKKGTGVFRPRSAEPEEREEAGKGRR